MTIHKEGYPTLSVVAIFLIAINIPAYFWIEIPWLLYLLWTASVLFFLFFLQFFRVPNRTGIIDDGKIISPADGKVVAIEETAENEYFKDKRIQISVFMSPLNVHINWFPISGVVKYFKYHPGLFLVAWHPKSSTDNERTTVVVEKPNGVQILFRQVAGAVARRIVWYVKEGDQAKQSVPFGFIKFGSRVDIFLPLDAKVKVEIDQKVTGSQTVLAEL